MGADHNTPSFTALADLASARVGGRALAASDEFFAPKTNLVNPVPPVFIPDKFTTRGKWMDGWESRRRRTPGHDWCVIRLGMRGRIHGFDVDTSYFTGNYPSHCGIDALDIARPVSTDLAAAPGPPWVEILPRSPLRGDSHNYFPLGAAAEQPWTHVRLIIHPDGGVARFRIYGEAVVDWTRIAARRRAVDLADIRLGGLVLGASDMHFGAKDNIIMPGRPKNMGDGWETRRRRGPGYDWALVRLGTSGMLTKIEIDTTHFKGNYPDSASVEGCFAPGATPVSLAAAEWFEILAQTKLEPHHRHVFSRELRTDGLVSHVRLNIFPDGGISRFRVYGFPAPS